MIRRWKGNGQALRIKNVASHRLLPEGTDQWCCWRSRSVGMNEVLSRKCRAWTQRGDVLLEVPRWSPAGHGVFALLETQEGCAVRFGEQTTTRIARANTFSLEHQRFWCDHRCWSSVWRRASDAHVLGPEEPEELVRDSVCSRVLISPHNFFFQ